MRRILSRAARAFFRPVAFFSKEFIEIWRQPRLILMLILGPFGVLLLFGVGYSSESTPIRTTLVIPEDSGLSLSRDQYEDQFVPPFELYDVVDQLETAQQLLRERRVDAVVIFPEHALQTIQGGQRATIEMLYNELDPIRRSWLEYYAYVQTSELNRRILLQAVQQLTASQSDASISEGVGIAQIFTDIRSIPPNVLVSPFQAAGRNIAPSSPDYVSFYAPGVLALLVQHIAVTFTALALVRERLSGAVELFRVGPVTPREILLGKYLSYFLQTALLTTILTLIMWLGLDITFLGSATNIAITLFLLIAASLGLGFVISAVSSTETQAVQLSLIILLASVFFSGFFLPIDNLIRPVWAVSYSLPVTYGVKALQGLMLRGEQPAWWIWSTLAAMTLIFLVFVVIAFQMSFKRR